MDNAAANDTKQLESEARDTIRSLRRDDSLSHISLQTAKRAVLRSALKTLDADDSGRVSKKEVQKLVKAIDKMNPNNPAVDSADEQSGGITRDMSFKSLVDHPEAADGLDGVDIRHSRTTSPPNLSVNIMGRLLAQLKAISAHVEESKNVEHLSRVARKLDKVLDACGIQVKNIDFNAQQGDAKKSFVDKQRFMHVGGPSLVFYCDVPDEGGIDSFTNRSTNKKFKKFAELPSGENIETLLKQRIGDMDMDEHDQLTQDTHGAKKKAIIRKGYHPALRSKVWRYMILGEEAKSLDPIAKEMEFHSLEDEIWHGHVPDYEELEHHVHVPDFGGPHNMFHSHPITEYGEAAVQRMLCILQHTHPDVVYCPFLPDLCSVLSLHLPQWEVYHLLDAMVERSKKDEWYFPLSGERFMCYVESFLLLMQLRMRPLAKHIEKLGVSMIEEVEVWFARMFVSFVPYDLVLRIVDCFLSEGAKMLFRTGLAVLKFHEKELMLCTSKNQFLNRFAKRMRMHTDTEELLTEAFNIRGFSRRMLSKLHATHEIKEIPFAKVPIFYMPQFKSSDSRLLSVTQLRKLWKHLPALMRIQDPVLLFTTSTHGYSLDTLLDRTGHQSAFIVIRTQSSSSFGVFLHWREDLAKHEIGEESFVFTLAPKLSCYHYYYSDPKRWGDTAGSAIAESSSKRSFSGGEGPAGAPVTDTDGNRPRERRLSDTPVTNSRRNRRQSEKQAEAPHPEDVANRRNSNSAPSSPLQRSLLLQQELEMKQMKPKDLGNWRQRRDEKESPKNEGVQGGGRMLGVLGRMASARSASSDYSDTANEPPTAQTRRRGNQLRMMDALNKSEINLWCRRTPQWFGIGSGDRVALGIDQRLMHGVTESTTAFYNPPLNGEKYHGDFKCDAIEVWGLTH
mmetsp:Transcript_7232/g.13465  ORF Transcript_7232/g.13465 Transcript_7232/m.13465 type:complete len:901 (+) Transcript_7232:135-2837(+)|eukprot:CAMPEP_0197535946 /NCGR_PEP_ID=MMETSP1318-20131121/52305_1 /TAXON_ID=552666 /ORGANISM="Partenskyella glossopodia, Strain RCC365" /LENGTH=900 /DNA_ID=CAMNT_0043093681 /DNA_START=151 /DNA_END=2853 /DNA_ORIENTATION=-